MTPEKQMQSAIELARRGAGQVSPNPMVGAVVVSQGAVLAQGYHHRFGAAHAEPDALDKLTPEESQGAELYVNLEPCSHFGKTPPCTERIIRAGIARVFVGMSDPNPLVSGKGIAALRAAGIEVITDVLKGECRRLNESFVTAMVHQRPFVTLKLAMTLDGKIALPNGRSQWITGPRSRTDVHAFRSTQDAIITGIGTVLADDCLMDVRHVKGPSPQRIILDTYLDIPSDARILQHEDASRTVIVTGQEIENGHKLDRLLETGVRHWSLPSEGAEIDLHALMARLYKEQMHAVMVESGRGVATSFLKMALVDKVRAYLAPKFFGKGLALLGDLGYTDPSDALTFTEQTMQPMGNDFLFEGYLQCLPD